MTASIPMPARTTDTPREAPSTVRARPVYVGPALVPLAAWWHAPAGPARDASVVLVPPFGVEAIFGRRALRHWAESLAAAGFAVLRYDHPGTGDSGGPDDAGADLWLAGVGHAIDAARGLGGVRRVALAGLRLGATLATLAAAGRDDVAALVLWAPVASGRALARELRALGRLGVAGDAAEPDGAIGAGGVRVTPAMLESIALLEPARLTRAPAPRALVVPRDDLPDDGVVAGRLAALGVEVETQAVAGFAGAVAEAHKTVVPRAVIDASVAWLDAALGSAPAPDAPRDDVARDLLAVDDLPVRERALHADGGRLAGVLAEPLPAAARRGVAIVLANAGAVPHVGPNRLYVTMAREWAALGFRVLRLDIGGIGDSAPSGGVPENHTYPPTAVSDLEHALEALRAEGESRFVVAGLCSGAHATFHLGVERPALRDVEGLVMINPIVFYWRPGDSLDVSAWRTYQDSRYYRQKARDPRAWARLLRGRSNLRSVAATAGRRVVQVAGAVAARLRALLDPPVSGELAHDLPALVQGGRQVALVFSEGDPGLDQLRLQAARQVKRLVRHPRFRLWTLAGADHTFTPLDAQRRLRALLASYLAETFR